MTRSNSPFSPPAPSRPHSAPHRAAPVVSIDDDELPPHIGERYRDVAHDIHRNSANPED